MDERNRVMALALPVLARRPLQSVAGLELVTAPICALALLLHPTPLTLPALLVGLLPWSVRWATIGRPWRATPFDTGLALFTLGALVGQVVTVAPAGSTVRLAGLASALILFAWVREHAASPPAAYRAAIIALIVVAAGGLLMLHVAQPFLRLDRVPPLGWLAGLLEPLGLYRLLVADEAALQRFRLYASGVGAVAAVGLAMTAGLALAARTRRRLVPLALGGLCFGALLLAADNRGSMLAAAITVGGLVVWWRPKLLLLAVLLVFGTLDLIALGVVQRGLSLRTILERVGFWQHGLELAAETPFTGVGLGVRSVQLVYRAAFQPTYPPFSHAHNVFVQAQLEQGIVGMAGLVLVTLMVIRLGPVRPVSAEPRLQAASFAALGGVLALLTAGLTEIVALTTVGGALLFSLLGLLAACHAADQQQLALSAEGRQESMSSRAARLFPILATPRREGSHADWLGSMRSLGFAFGMTGVVVVCIVSLVYGRQLAALPLLNAGTSALYAGTLDSGLSRSPRADALSRAVSELRLAVSVNPTSLPARRNLALALAASGDREGARQVADEISRLANPSDRDALFGVGRAYAAAGAWEQAIATWSEIGAGVQLLRLGRELAQGPDWQAGNAALVAAARVGAPGRSAPDAITRSALARGLSPEAAVEQLSPLLDAGGTLAYEARLQAAHVYRQAGRLDLAEQALADALRVGHDDEAELERALIRIAEDRLPEAEPTLTELVARYPDELQGLPDGDDPRYWLAFVQLRLGKPDDALATARAGIADLTTDQASLRAPYQAVLGESLLALGRPAEALAAFRAGLRVVPGDAALADGARRAQAALEP